MGRLRSVSAVMTVVGVVILLGTVVFGWGATWGLIGLLLAWAGAVKVLVVRLWRGLDQGGSAPDAGPREGIAAPSRERPAA